MNAIVKSTIGALSTKFAGLAPTSEMSDGVSGGFGRIGYKGKSWSTHYRGETHVLTNIPGDMNSGAQPTIEMVIVKASGVLSKTFYEKGFVEGSVEPPDCLSSNGVTPDASAPKKQAASCALCPHNRFGSDIKQDGTAGKGKRCRDVKRLAVVPLADIPNEGLGGPVLLRVPAMSLNDLATYDANLRKMGYPYYAVGTRIGFDIKESYPKFVFSPIRALTDAEADQVLALRADPTVDRILAEISEHRAEAPEQEAAPPMQFEQAPVTPPVISAPVAPVAPAAVTPPAPVAPKPRKPKAPVAPAPVAPAPVAPAPVAPAPVAPVAAKPSGFGGGAAAAPAPVAQAPAVAPSTDDFDASIDDQLEGLMAKI